MFGGSAFSENVCWSMYIEADRRIGLPYLFTCTRKRATTQLSTVLE